MFAILAAALLAFLFGATIGRTGTCSDLRLASHTASDSALVQRVCKREGARE